MQSFNELVKYINILVGNETTSDEKISWPNLDTIIGMRLFKKYRTELWRILYTSYPLFIQSTYNSKNNTKSESGWKIQLKTKTVSSKTTPSGRRKNLQWNAVVPAVTCPLSFILLLFILSSIFFFCA